MALIFSKVNLISENLSTEFLVGGIPNCKEDLNNWTNFDNFINKLNFGEDVKVLTTSYRYGEQEDNDASPEEIAYFMERIKMKPTFIEDRTEKISNFNFSFKVC